MTHKHLETLCDLTSAAHARIQQDFKTLDPVVGVSQKMRASGIPVDAMTIDCLKSGKRIIIILHDHQPEVLSYQFSFKDKEPANEFEQIPFAEFFRNRQNYLPRDSEYLFPGIAGRGYYRDTKSVREIVKSQTGISVTNHDLRRTYKSIGTELDINSVLVDELLSHAREGVDAHYIHPSMTKLREASQRIADYMVSQAGFDLINRLTDRW